MKALGNAVRSGLCILTVVVAVGGCSKSSQNAMTESGSAAAASGSAGAMQAGMSLINQLGGMSTVTALADAFGVNIGADPILSKIFDTAGIMQTKQGLVNEVAKASGMALPNPGVDLLSTLSGKGLDASATGALTNALAAAADQVHLGEAQKTAVLGLLTPITNQLVGNK